MSLKTQYEFLFVGKEEGSFVENYAYDLGESGEHSGKIFINLEIQNNPAEAEMIGETIFDTVRKTFFVDLEKDPYVRFEDSVKAINLALNAIRNSKASRYIGNMNVILAAIVENNLYLTQCGEAEAYLVRKRLLTVVSDGLGEDGSTDFFTNIASGTLEVGDFVLFNTTRLLRYIAKNDLAKICSGRNFIAALSDLKDFLSTEVLGKVGIIGMSVLAGRVDFSDVEKGQIQSHLEKEELYAVDDLPAPRRMEREKSDKADYTNALQTISSFMDGMKGRIVDMSGKLSGKKVGRRLQDGEKDKQQKILALMVVGIIVLGGLVWWNGTLSAQQQLLAKYDKMLDDATLQIGTAETNGRFNKDQAAVLLNDAESKALEVLNSGQNRAKANMVLKSIQETRDRLDGVIRPQLQIIADLAQKRSDVSAIGLLSLNKVLYAYEYNALYPILLDKLQDPLTIDEEEKVVSATAYEDKDSLLFYTQSGKLKEFKDNRMSFVDTADGVFKKGVEIKDYKNYLYILDPENNQIWKYSRPKDRFDKPIEYIVNADVKNGVSFAIDASIYVLNKDGYITKLLYGSKEDFPIKKQPVKALTSPTKIFTEPDMKDIYVLDPVEKRILVFAKDVNGNGATYTQQFILDDVADLRDLYVEKDTGKIYVLDQSKVYLLQVASN